MPSPPRRAGRLNNTPMVWLDRAWPVSAGSTSQWGTSSRSVVHSSMLLTVRERYVHRLTRPWVSAQKARCGLTGHINTHARAHAHSVAKNDRQSHTFQWADRSIQHIVREGLQKNAETRFLAHKNNPGINLVHSAYTTDGYLNLPSYSCQLVANPLANIGGGALRTLLELFILRLEVNR